MLIKQCTIWIIAVAVALPPLVLLASRNPRALPIGALLIGLVSAFFVGAYLVVLETSPMNQNVPPARAAAIWVAVLTVLVVLSVLNLYVMKGPASQRLIWTLWSTLTWLYVLGVMYVAGLQIHEGKRQAASDAVWAESRQREAEVQRLRAELDRFPDRRRAVVESAVIELRKHVAASHETLERVLVFGDPATAPADVVVWGVLSVRPEYGWRSFSLHAHQSHHVLNSHLRRNGYPFPIALGFAPTADVDSAGGDAAYFGHDGSAVIPQFPPDVNPGSRARPLEVPRR